MSCSSPLAGTFKTLFRLGFYRLKSASFFVAEFRNPFVTPKRCQMAKKKMSLRNGIWSKRIKKETFYFGKDYDSALAQWEKQEPFLRAGIPLPDGDGPTVRELLNAFLSDRLAKVQSDQMTQETYDGYVLVCDKIAATIPVVTKLESLKPGHFTPIRDALAKGKTKQLCLKSHDRWLGYARAVFRFASIDNLLIDRPLPYSRALACISKREMRKYRSEQPSRIVTTEDIHAVIESCLPNLRCMVLLAINGGLNNKDVSQLRLADVAEDPAVLDYPRRKTYFPRKTPLWPETREAIKVVISRHNRSSEFLFVTKFGNSYDRKDSVISDLFRDRLKSADRYVAGKNFGALRTTFAEIGREVGDDMALKALMGHSDGSQLYESYASGVYLPRLERVTEHVRGWLFTSTD